MKKEPSKEIKRLLITIGIIASLLMIGTFVLSVYLLTQVWDNESLLIMAYFIVAQLIGFIVLIVIFAFFSAYYEYNEYWARAMWDQHLDIGSRINKILKELSNQSKEADS